MVSQFLTLCKDIQCPVSEEKTEWASMEIIFLGVLLNGNSLVLGIPEEKRMKALNILNWVVNKKSLTIKQMQRLTGILNFLNWALFAGRPFTRRMYAKFSNLKDKQEVALQPYHHVQIDNEFKVDCGVWITFLQSSNQVVLCHPFVDLCGIDGTTVLPFYSDASKNPNFGIGAYFKGMWTYAKWEQNYIQICNPSIEYLELLALCVAVFTWQEELVNLRSTIFCDNLSVVSMINQTTSSCKNCMKLIRMLVLNNLRNNTRIFAKHVTSRDNFLADAPSRLDFARFWRLAPQGTKKFPEKLPRDLWPPTHLWMK